MHVWRLINRRVGGWTNKTSGPVFVKSKSDEWTECKEIADCKDLLGNQRGGGVKKRGKRSDQNKVNRQAKGAALRSLNMCPQYAVKLNHVSFCCHLLPITTLFSVVIEFNMSWWAGAAAKNMKRSIHGEVLFICTGRYIYTLLLTKISETKQIIWKWHLILAIFHVCSYKELISWKETPIKKPWATRIQI